jgi:hypothetical protein
MQLISNVPANVRFLTRFQCPHCRNRGAARWEGYRRPWNDGALEVSLVSVEPDFLLSPEHDVSCRECGAIILPHDTCLTSLLEMSKAS